MSFEPIVNFIKELYQPQQIIPLHEPRFAGNEKKYILETIDSTMVSSVGPFVNKFEDAVKTFVGAQYAVATVNGTSGLHIALKLAGTDINEEVLTPALTFVATANAIAYCHASPVFIDSERTTMGVSPEKLEEFLKNETTTGKNGDRYNRTTGRRIAACMPMHVFGHSCAIETIQSICNHYSVALVEDAAESLGTLYNGKHTGTFGVLGVYSFNGNKTITTGGGGMIVTDNKDLARRAKHITTTAKKEHQWEYVHDEIGYNYRLPNINAALGCAQMEQLPKFIAQKRKLSGDYQWFFDKIGMNMFTEKAPCTWNCWLNSILFDDCAQRDAFLKYSNEQGIRSRPIWQLINTLPMYKTCQTTNLENAQWLADRVVNIPSSPIFK